MPAVERVAEWLSRNLPTTSAPTLVHGDFRLGNVILGRIGGQLDLRAVLDWEMSTIGDPLADVGYLTMLWISPGDPPLGVLEATAGVTRQPDFASREELAVRYEELSGRALGALGWYQTLALWKAAVFMEGNFKRAQREPERSAELAEFGETVRQLAERAEAVGPGGSAG
jgi:aminoglycoside phosphotransferase (APT) family kinase protein